MKPIYPYALLGALFAVGSLNAATTTPVGYTTESLQSGFNLIGITLHQPVVAAGTLTAVGTGSVTDSNAQFSQALTSGTTYLLEITSGTQKGAVQEFTAFTNTEITTPDLSAVGVAAGNTYKIRAVATISSVFGADNSAGLQESDSPAGADIIWVPNGSGGYNQYYRNQGLVIGETVIVAPSWQSIGGAEAGNVALTYSDGLFIQRKGSATSLVVTGEVKVTSTRVVLPTGFTIVSSGFPVGSTLDNSGLQNFLAPGDSPESADIVWVPTGPGTYNQYYYNQGLVIGETVIVPPSWQTLSGQPAGTTELPSAVFIQKKGAQGDAEISVPYSL